MSKNEMTFVDGFLQLGFTEVNFDESENVVSASQFAKWRKCPKSWELNYIHKHKTFEQNIHTVYGTAMHEVVQQWLFVMYKKSGKAAKAMDLKKRLKETMHRVYLENLKKNDGVHFSNKEELLQHYMYGCAILEFLQKKRAKYFKLRDWELMGIEVPIWISPDEEKDPVKLMGYIDVILYDKKFDEYLLIDIKTSKKGWNKWKKKDKIATDQLVLYKKYFSEQYGIEPEKVDVQFFVLKSIIDEDSMWAPKRVQQVKPSNGKISLNRVERSFLEFIDSCFNNDGTYNKEGDYPAVTGQNGWNCTFCPYKDNEELCPKEKRIECIESD